MINSLVRACAAALGLAPELFVVKVDVARAAGYEDIDAIAAALLDCSAPDVDVYVSGVLPESDPTAEVAVCPCDLRHDRGGDADVRMETERELGQFINRRGQQWAIAEIPSPWELTGPEEAYATSAAYCALRRARYRPNPNGAEQTSLGQSQCGASSDGKEDA